MDAKELDYKPFTNKGWAARDGIIRSRVNSHLYSDHQRLKAERIKLGLEMVYVVDSVFINYRKTKITIKIVSPKVRDRKNLRLLEQDWAAQGVTKSQTAQGIIYSFS